MLYFRFIKYTVWYMIFFSILSIPLFMFSIQAAVNNPNITTTTMAADVSLMLLTTSVGSIGLSNSACTKTTGATEESLAADL